MLTTSNMSTSIQKQPQPDGEASLPVEMAGVAREVVLLRTELIKIELREQIEAWLNPLLRKSCVAGIIGVGVLFMLVAAAVVIGDALDDLGWGLLIVGGGVALAGGAFGLARPKLLDLGEKTAMVDAKLLEPRAIELHQPDPRSAELGLRSAEAKLTKTQLEREIQAREQLLESDFDDLTHEAREQFGRYTKVVVPLAIVLLTALGVVVWKLARREVSTARRRLPR